MKRKLILLTTLVALFFVGYGQNTLNENFDASTTLPSDWTFILDGEQEEENELEASIWVEDTEDNSYYSGRALSGENSLWLLFQYCMDENSKIYMISPKLSITSSNDSFKFNLFVDNFSPNGYGKFSVLVSTSSNAKEDFSTTPLLQVETSELFTGWDEYEVDLSTYVGQDIYVAIVFADYGSYTWFFVDDITGPELATSDNPADTCSKITTLPFKENFNGWEWSEIPECWKWIGYDFYQGMYYPTTLVNGYNGSNWLAFLGADGTEQMVVSLPELGDNIAVNTLELQLDVTNYTSGKLVIGVMNDPLDISTFVEVDTIIAPNQTWTHYTVDFSQYTGTGRYISLRVGVPYDNVYTLLGVDNLSLNYITNPNSTYDTIAESICMGDSYTFKGEEKTEAGVYFDTLSVGEGGVAEIQVLILSVNPVYAITINDTINEGETYTDNGFNESQSGTYTLELQTINGCDSVITLNLVVETLPCENVTTTLNESICEGESFEFNNTTYSQEGTYVANLQTLDGCDSTVTLNLVVNPSYSLSIDANINEGETYTENGFNEHIPLNFKQ
ncbi:MAG: choice-of-anchor J domain-containing protein [Bacteroidota bacterium]|nr:choice-of-anchor J domain-containing protein [Bacteroidota bacterium]